MDQDLQQITLKWNGMTFSGLACGPEHSPLVVMLHGFPQFADAWTRVMPILAQTGFRVVAFDQRGYASGARPEDVSSYATDALVDDVLACADSLGHETFHVVGHDWGGFLAWRLAARHAQRVQTVAVLSTPHPDAFREALANDPEQQAKSQYIQLFRMPGHVAEGMLLAADAALLRRVYQDKLQEDQVARNVQRLSEPGALTAALNWYRALKVAEPAGPVSVPSLYLWGDQDLALGRVAAETTARFITGPYRFEMLQGVSHWILEDAPQRVTDLLLEHLTSA